jgi:hypothetical protein
MDFRYRPRGSQWIGEKNHPVRSFAASSALADADDIFSVLS